MRWAGEVKRRKPLVGGKRGSWIWIAQGCWTTPQGRWGTDLFQVQIFNIVITIIYLLLLYVYYST